MIANYIECYCCEDISQIENYEQAVNDTTQTWHCHHRLETDQDLSMDELIKRNMYYKRPADELIFLTNAEHIKLHSSGENHPMYGKHHTEESRKKMSNTRKGTTPWNKGIPQSKEQREKHSKVMKGKLVGENNPMYGKTGDKHPAYGHNHTEEAKEKMSESKKQWYKEHEHPSKGKHRVYHTDGTYHYEK